MEKDDMLFALLARMNPEFCTRYADVNVIDRVRDGCVR